MSLTETLNADAFHCPECLGRGTVLSGGNNPSPWEVSCDVCNGSGELSADAFLDYAMDRIGSSRNLAHMFHKNRETRDRYRDEARYWIGFAKKARAVVLEREHAGAAHVNREAA